MTITDKPSRLKRGVPSGIAERVLFFGLLVIGALTSIGVAAELIHAVTS